MADQKKGAWRWVPDSSIILATRPGYVMTDLAAEILRLRTACDELLAALEEIAGATWETDGPAANGLGEIARTALARYRGEEPNE